MSDCASIVRRLPGLAAGALEEAEAAELELHLAGCAACRAAREHLDRTVAAFASLPPARPSARVWAGIRDGMERELTKPPARRRSMAWLAPAWGLAAASLILVLFVATPSTRPPGARLASGRAVIDGRELAVGALIPDGALVEIPGGRAELDFGPARAALAAGSRLRVVTSAGRSVVRLEAGSGDFEALRVETSLGAAEGTFSLDLDGWGGADLRVAATGTWRELGSGRERPIAEYAAFVADRAAAREAGARWGRREPGAREDGERLLPGFEERRAHRAAADLAWARWSARLRLDPPASGRLRDAVSRIAREGEAKGLPAGWLSRRSVALANPADRSNAMLLKGELESRVAPGLDAAQREDWHELLEDEEEGDDDDDD